jgi:hypothetical protein
LAPVLGSLLHGDVIARARPMATVATPTTIAVRIRTWGSGFEYTVTPSRRIGVEPPMILPAEMKRIKTEVWKMPRPMSFLTMFPRAITP